LRRIGPVLALLVLGFALHGLPYVKTPFATDVNHVFRLQAVAPSDSLAQHIPENFRALAAYPTASAWSAFLGWHGLTGRYNLLDTTTLRAIGVLAPHSPIGWKLIVLAFGVGCSVFLYLLLCRLGIRLEMAWWTAALSLFLVVDDFWVEYKAAEPRAAFFFLMAAWLTALPKFRWRHILAAAAMGAAVLTKETFVVGWVSLAALHLSQQPETRPISIRNLLRWMAPHALVAVGFAGFVLFLRTTVPVSGAYAALEQTPSLWDWRALVVTFVPAPLEALPVAVGVTFLLFANRDSYMGLRLGLVRLWQSRATKVLIAGILVHALVHVVLYRLSGRIAGGRYSVPLNFTGLIIVALLIAHLWEDFKMPMATLQTGIVLALLLSANLTDRLTVFWTSVPTLTATFCVANGINNLGAVLAVFEKM
jgi:hypothetical protein